MFTEPWKSRFREHHQIDLYRHLIEGKSVAIVANQTSMVGKTHLVDTLLSIGIKVNVIFAPEHGFRDLADAGERSRMGKIPKQGFRLSAFMGIIINQHQRILKGLILSYLIYRM